MDFEDDELTAFSEEISQFLKEAVGEAELRRIHLRGDGHDAGVHRLLAEQGWVAGPWPVAYGGLGWSPLQTMAFRLGLRRGGYPAILLATSTFVGHVIQELGTEFHKEAVLPSLAAGDAVICLGYTEPDSGSDVMAARTRAVREGDEWVIDGTKMFTTGAHLAQYTFLLARTNADVPKHQGLTMFLVPLDAPGITINPVYTITNERSNLVFYDAVRINDRWRIGDVNGGVRVLALALQLEQGTSFVPDLECLYGAALAWARASGMIDDPVVRGAIAECALDIELSILLLQQGVWRRTAGWPDEGRGPMSKLYSSERLVHHVGLILDLMGEAGCLVAGTQGEVGAGEAERLYRFAQGTTIYGGTSEILRSRIAEAGLGLARSRA